MPSFSVVENYLQRQFELLLMPCRYLHCSDKWGWLDAAVIGGGKTQEVKDSKFRNETWKFVSNWIPNL